MPVQRLLSHFPRVLLVLGVLLILTGVEAAPVFAQSAEVRQVELIRRGQQLSIRLFLNQPPVYQITENLDARTLVVKFRNTKPGFPDGSPVKLFNDSQVEGVRFLEVGPDLWAQFKFREAGLVFDIDPPEAPNILQLTFRPSKQLEPLPPVEPGAKVRLLSTDFRSVDTEDGLSGHTRLTLIFSEAPRLFMQQHGVQIELRFPNTLPAEDYETPEFEDGRVRLERLDSDESQVFLTLAMLGSESRVERNLREKPPRWEVDVYGVAVAAPEPEPEGELSPEEELRLRNERVIAKNRKIQVQNLYQQGENAFRKGDYEGAVSFFKQSYSTAKNNVGVFEDTMEPSAIRALYRKADTIYTMLERRRGRNFHEAIDAYLTALRVSEDYGLIEDLAPHAYFRIGRSYQRMKFTQEANTNFEKLKSKFPTSLEASEANFWKALNQIERRDWEQAIKDFEEYLQVTPNPRFLAETHYRMAQAFYHLDRPIIAKEHFDNARGLDPQYVLEDPTLLFHMGETYYENADFMTARETFRALLDRYPKQDFTKLVALRLGDFLRDEGKEEQAIRAYEQAINSYSREIALLGKLRIANIQATRPYSDEYLEAIDLYDEIVRLYPDAPQSEEALLRKGLTLTLYGMYKPAIEELEKYQEKHPLSPYVRRGVVRENIDENLKGLIDNQFQRQELLELIANYRDYKAKYLLNFRFDSTLFQVAVAHQRLGFYEEALDLLKFLDSRAQGTMLELIRLQTALALVEKGDPSLSRDQFTRFLTDYPDSLYDADARFSLAQVYRESKEYDKARIVYEQTIQKYDNDEDPLRMEVVPELWYELGQMYEEIGRYAESGRAYHEAIAKYRHPVTAQDTPQFIIDSHFRAGEMLSKVQSDQEALRLYQNAVANYAEREAPETRKQVNWARYQIGVIQVRLGMEKEALETFRQLVASPEGEGEMWKRLASENHQNLTRQFSYQQYLKQ
ncbi:MAG: hypothetical protein CL923_10340 [Deltaproteobacteria bacterium]|nr:hypothetical protein [Deltaproteobacteria bacterium]